MSAPHPFAGTRRAAPAGRQGRPIAWAPPAPAATAPAATALVHPDGAHGKQPVRGVALAAVATLSALLAAAAPALAQAPTPAEAPAPAGAASPSAASADATATPPSPAPADAAAPPPPAPPPASPAAAPGARQRVEVTGSAPGEDPGRRNATASRITIGREELERMGDSNLAEVLKRLPGVTIGGTPGRGGPIRMRGMAAGYTQILIDGQRMPPGFSLEQIAPEQIERIEIMRAPVAEHGTRAIAGTINVILRSDFRRKANEWRLGIGSDGGRPQAGLTLQRNGQSEALGYNLSATLFDNRQGSQGATALRHAQADGTPTLVQDQASSSRSHNRGVFANARLSWKLGGGDALELQPFLNRVSSSGTSRVSVAQSVNTEDSGAGGTPPYAPAYTLAESAFRSQWQMARLTGLWRATTAGGGRLETRFGGTLSTREAHTDRLESGGRAATDGSPGGIRSRVTDTDVRDWTVDLKGSYAQLLAERHSLKTGWELDQRQRRDRTEATVNGATEAFTDSGETYQATVRRAALWAQDEWDWTPRLAVYAGARWEGIATTATGMAVPVDHRSSVFTPLAHLVYKLPGADGKPGRDQIRASLTRSYRAPDTQQLVARRQYASSANPLDGLSNSPTQPDREGNTRLRPELAWSLEMAYERYGAGGGFLGVNAYYKRIDDLIRNVTSGPQVVDYSSALRYVSRPENIGRADTAGLELELRGRAADLGLGDLPLTLRGNATLMWSQVDALDGGGRTRMDGQAPWMLNLGADWALRGLPLSLGASWNYTPSYATQPSSWQTNRQGARSVIDANALWRLSADTGLRLTASNLFARTLTSGTTYTLPASGATQSSDSRTETFTVVNLRLEMRF